MIENMFTDEEMRRYEAMQEKRWVRVDPDTKKLHESAKDSFWKIENVNGVVRAGENMNDPRANFFIVRYHRNQTYRAKPNPMEDLEVTKHMPVVERRFDGTMSAPACRNIEAADFARQFVEDK